MEEIRSILDTDKHLHELRRNLTWECLCLPLQAMLLNKPVMYNNIFRKYHYKETYITYIIEKTYSAPTGKIMLLEDIHSILTSSTYKLAFHFFFQFFKILVTAQI